ncbi:MAG TPA: R3H domain-containing nucleic acid-binding protein [Chloroflexota bacterium]|jgi:stage III sporulation protein SpoIIIAA
MAQSSEARPQPRIVCDDLDALLDVLPPRIRIPLREQNPRADLLEVVMDLGREPEARYPGREAILSDEPVTSDDLAYVIERIGAFGEDNRAGIERTLHRISAIRNRAGRVVGLTARVGRAVFGTIDIIRDIVETGHSILLLGRPGVGKTTMLRETARVLADDLAKRVIIVDTSNEIAGDGDIPHPAIGRARRMQVARPTMQHAVMIEAVENHMPEVIVIDEIGTELEAAAARTIAERGVQLVATAHGNTLENLMLNPTLADLVGGIQTVTLGDEEARRRGTQKSILERKAPPTFDVVVEIQQWDRVAVHENVADVVDELLRGEAPTAAIRYRDETGAVQVERAIRRSGGPPSLVAVGGRGGPRLQSVGFRGDTYRPEPARGEPSRGDMYRSAPTRGDSRRGAGPVGRAAAPAERVLHVYPFGVNRVRLEHAIRGLQLPAALAAELDGADAVLTVKNYYRRKPQPLRDAEASGIPIFVLRSNTQAQMEEALVKLTAGPGLPRDNGRDDGGDPLEETEEAIQSVLDTSQPVDLTPQNSYIRRLQHQLAERYNLGSRSAGREPYRHVRIFKP